MPRRLGQHFLRRESILDAIAIAACGPHTPRVIEIGPGRAALTRKLLPRTDELHVVELDSTLVAHLEQVYAAEAKLHIHHANVLDVDLSQWGPAVIAGNLPYYITSPIIEQFLQLSPAFPRAVFLVQAEVAARLTARPGTRDYGYLTVATQLLCDAKSIVRVPAAAFAPPPKVDSTVVVFERKHNPPDDYELLRTFVGRCFAQKRKMLRNNLRPFYADAVDTLPEANLRAEQLSLESFVRLFRQLKPS